MKSMIKPVLLQKIYILTLFKKKLLRGSGSRSADTTKRITWSKPEKWCSLNSFESGSIDPTKWIILITLVIDISCSTMHYGKFVCLLSTKWLPIFQLKQHIGQYHWLQDKHIIWEYLHTVLLGPKYHFTVHWK